ncbi:uncharacterized protein LOC18436111 [Amborella trichopoda]|uniref:GCK domain-containing protein n=1 Tax=Amborella trichopoda TaxID=13333 RepID=W1PJF2_AMBTC|nr:uncharacterized protein LOC18436111 [Amborella trichopoda]ERN07874.1 hypothetical protein AMTR_s00012p00219010 [Amborella trichopoda]|eukprot:XP_006846199.1 uncharacterized protein LOC18436111 [Amborella trichopoda]
MSAPSEHPHPETLENKDAMDNGASELDQGSGDGAGVEVEEEECGFCLFMKGGGCGEEFIAWEKCVEEGETKKEDIVEKCFEVTSYLKKCMDEHSAYYEPILRAEKAMEEQASAELDPEEGKNGGFETEDSRGDHVSDKPETIEIPPAPSPIDSSSQSQNPISKTLENIRVEENRMEKVASEIEHGSGEGEGEGEEEDGECGFCLFMKGGGCRDEFIAWEKCVEDGEKNKENIVEKCSEITGLLRKCMDEHSDYYEPILRAEKELEKKASAELDQKEGQAGNPEKKDTELNELEKKETQ